MEDINEHKDAPKQLAVGLKHSTDQRHDSTAEEKKNISPFTTPSSRHQRPREQGMLNMQEMQQALQESYHATPKTGKYNVCSAVFACNFL